MRKYLLMSGVMVCITLLLVGCSSETAKESPKSDTNTIASTSANITENEIETSKKLEDEKQTVDSSEVTDTKTSTDKTAKETTPLTESSIQASTKQTTSKVTSPTKKEEQPKVNKPETKEPESQNSESEKTESPKQTEPAKEQSVSFDVTPYVSYANSYAQSIGLDTGTPATDCWDNPISANAGKKNIKADIQSRLNRYKNVEGCNGIWVWTTNESKTDYLIYIGYY